MRYELHIFIILFENLGEYYERVKIIRQIKKLY